MRSITGCYHPDRIEDHKTHDFFAYQAVVGLHGDWGRLAERCERVIADPPGSSGELKYSRDHKFYLALAHQDVPAMEQALGEIVTPHALKSRANDESGFTEGLISSWAVIYAKIAWLHGYEVKVDSLHIPLAWLPITPLPIYDVGYGFLRGALENSPSVQNGIGLGPLPTRSGPMERGGRNRTCASRSSFWFPVAFTVKFEMV